MVASLTVEHGLQSTGLVVVAHRLSCAVACGIIPDQRLNPRLLHWQADSLPLRHHGSPQVLFVRPTDELSQLCYSYCFN